jgi:hypothetical protein
MMIGAGGEAGANPVGGWCGGNRGDKATCLRLGFTDVIGKIEAVVRDCFKTDCTFS